MKIKIIPAILAKTQKEFIRQLRIFERYFNLVQLDIMDNKFVANKTFKSSKLIGRIKTSVSYELHLMVNKPSIYITRWSKNRKVKRIIFHYESVKKKEIEVLISKIHQHKIQVGIALNPETPVKVIKPYIKDIDYVLLMSVNPGFSGQKLKQNIFKKIRTLRQFSQKIKIGVDGGINDTNAKKLIMAGANVLNVAGYLLYSTNIELAVKKLSN